MMSESELLQEQQYTALVQQLLVAAIESSKEASSDHISSIKQLLADAWEELRMKTTALSEQDMQQIAGEVDRYLARKTLNDDLAARYERMLMNPFFARVDFRENGSDITEKIVIGLYSLRGAGSDLLVHDWRAPVCSLYYDDLPGPVSYESPSGTISGEMTLKRQYKMEDGKLKYYVNTDVSIEDELLLDILSGATQRRIRQIVATIQTEQNKAIRYGNEKLLSVIGGAGSGKTSVAMHRIAFLMYRYRNKLDASKILVLSPSNSFSEYISTVLPELGEENTASVTLYKLVSGLIPGKIEKPLAQTEVLLDENSTLRRESVRYKSGAEFLTRIREFVKKWGETGPEFGDIMLDSSPLARREELERMFRTDFTSLLPALRIERIRSVLEGRMERWEIQMLANYKEQLRGRYRGKDLDNAARFNVSHRLQPVRRQIKAMLNVNTAELYAQVLEGAPEELLTAAKENAAAGIVWWEDAPCMALLMVLMGFITPDKSLRHLVVDEAQDYSACALGMLNAYYPLAHETILGDPKQRTCPAMPPLDPKMWEECFETPGAPLLELTRCYRSTLGITRLCNAILPDAEQVQPFGREGLMPEIAEVSDQKILDTVAAMKAAGMQSIAIITRNLADADRISRFVPQAHLLDGSDEDILNDPGDVAVGSYHLMKGLEFDAVITVWPEARLSDGERRRLYTACSRALHRLTMLTTPKMIENLGIIL